MINGKEILNILIISLIFAVTISLFVDIISFIYAFVIMFVIIFLSVLAKEITAFYLDSEVETKLWEIKQFGYKPKNKFRKPAPAGIFLPLIVTALSAGYLYWFAALVFEVQPKVYRAAKRHGLYTFSEMTEYHIGIIAAAGIFMCLILAIIGYLISVPELSRLSIYYAFFNMIPISNLDGNKIFFGSFVMWSFLAILTLIGLGYALFLV